MIEQVNNIIDGIMNYLTTMEYEQYLSPRNKWAPFSSETISV